MKNIYCTIDTETVGGAANPDGTYNIGCAIHDKEGHIYATTSLLVMEHYDKIRDNSFYGKKNFPLYEERLCKGDITAVATEEEAIALIRNLCRMYNVKYIMAYNSIFDFTKTVCKELLDEFEFIDIYLMALQTVTHLKKYARFCRENNLLSKSKKSLSTSAESVYAYFTDNADYEEEHTALADALIEMEIFKRCDAMHKKYTKNCHQRYCKSGKCFPRIEERKVVRPSKQKVELTEEQMFAKEYGTTLADLKYNYTDDEARKARVYEYINMDLELGVSAEKIVAFIDEVENVLGLKIKN